MASTVVVSPCVSSCLILPRLEHLVAAHGTRVLCTVGLQKECKEELPGGNLRISIWGPLSGDLHMGISIWGSASGDLYLGTCIWESGDLEISESGNPEIWKSQIQKSDTKQNYENANPFCPQGPDS